ncbi:MAG: tetratricopeptide repeat protein [candidate division WOR-3 bacterium]
MIYYSNTMKIGKIVSICWIIWTMTYAQNDRQAIIYSSSDSIKKYQRLVKQSSGSESDWFALQNAFIQAGDFQSALKIPTACLSDRLLWGQIRVLFYTHQFDSCKRYIFELATRFAKSPYLNDALQLAFLLFQAQNDTVVLKKFADAQYFYEINKFANVIALLQPLLAEQNIVAEFGYLLLSKVFLTQNQSNQAIATLQEFMMKFPKSLLIPKAHYQLGIIYLEAIRDTTNARNVFENLISSYPESPESYFARAQLSLIGSDNKTK